MGPPVDIPTTSTAHGCNSKGRRRLRLETISSAHPAAITLDGKRPRNDAVNHFSTSAQNLQHIFTEIVSLFKPHFLLPPMCLVHSCSRCGQLRCPLHCGKEIHMSVGPMTCQIRILFAWMMRFQVGSTKKQSHNSKI